MKKAVLAALILITLIAVSIAEAATDKYVANPIVFVHGFGAGNWDSWQTARNTLNKYFYDDIEQLQYDYANLDNIPRSPEYYPPFLKLEYPGNTGVDDAGKYLKRAIGRALYLMPECSSIEKKVILVAHSMGGLAVRDFLKNNPSYVKSIKKVIFVGTPHQGSPLANFVYILNDIKRSYLPALIEEQRYNALDVGEVYFSGVGGHTDIEGEYFAYLNLIQTH